MSQACILIAEDDAVLAAALRQRLGEMGYEVAGVVATGEEAVTQATTLRPELVRMDIRLRCPLNGVEAAATSRGQADVPASYLTADAHGARVSAAQFTEGCAYLAKLVRDEELWGSIDVALHKSRQAEEALQQALAEAWQCQALVSAVLQGDLTVLQQADFASAARAALDLCRQVIGVTGGYVALLAPDGVITQVWSQELDGGAWIVDPGLRLPFRGLYGQAYQTGRVVYHNDVAGGAEAGLLPDGHPPVDNVLIAPLVLEGQVVALLGLANKPGGVTENDARLAATFGELAAVALKNIRTRESLEQSEGRYRVLFQRAKQLTRQLLTAQEAERRHLARELHDEIGQVLTAVRVHLQIVQQACGAAAAGAVEESLNIVDRAIQQVRGMAFDLRPSVLDDLGLSAALRWYLDGQAQRSGLTVRLVAPAAGQRPSADLEIVCYRLTQEAVTNVLRHARARQVEVELLQDAEGLYLTIRDDGIGFDPAAAWQHTTDGGCLGLLGMRERVELVGGQFSLDSAPGQGTVVRASFPLSQPEGDRRDAGL